MILASSKYRKPLGNNPWLVILLALFVYAGCAGAGAAKKDNVDNAATISGEEISHETTTNINQLIVGRVPGISISQSPDGRVVARIRGKSSFTGDDSPLYVVDGMPVEPNSDGSLPGVYVSEIESIRVLKDPTDTARWGMRGSNGVIEVKTKIGRGN